VNFFATKSEIISSPLYPGHYSPRSCMTRTWTHF
jgi:hypothetical protein